MSAGDTYYTVPLSLLHSGGSAREVLDHAVSCGIVNAGLGHRKTHGEPAFQTLLAQAIAAAQAKGEPTKCPQQIDPHLWEAALAGSQLIGIRGGSRTWDIKVYQQNVQSPRQVFFRVRADWLWNAVYHARNLEGDDEARYDKPFPWREFRIVAALLSAQVNSHGFTFIGWEGIRARACGYHSKALFQAAYAHDTLPAHCQPLTRDVIRRELEKLEALGFFARVRYATGKRGGFTAYSFRHPKRDELITAVKTWAAANASFKAKVKIHRSADLVAFRRSLPPPAHARPPSPAPAPTPTSTPDSQLQPQPPPSSATATATPPPAPTLPAASTVPAPVVAPVVSEALASLFRRH